MSACQDYEEQLTLHAAQALEPEEEARVRAHLEDCDGCRQELASTAGLLAQVALPSLSPAAQETLEALPRRVVGAWRRQQVRQALRARTLGALMAVAAVLALVLVPSLTRRQALPASPLPDAVAAPSEAQAVFEQWASANPLAEALEPLGSEDALEDWEDGDDGLFLDSELF